MITNAIAIYFQKLPIPMTTQPYLFLHLSQILQVYFAALSVYIILIFREFQQFIYWTVES